MGVRPHPRTPPLNPPLDFSIECGMMIDLLNTDDCAGFGGPCLPVRGLLLEHRVYDVSSV